MHNYGTLVVFNQWRYSSVNNPTHFNQKIVLENIWAEFSWLFPALVFLFFVTKLVLPSFSSTAVFCIHVLNMVSFWWWCIFSDFAVISSWKQEDLISILCYRIFFSLYNLHAAELIGSTSINLRTTCNTVFSTVMKLIKCFMTFLNNAW